VILSASTGFDDIIVSNNLRPWTEEDTWASASTNKSVTTRFFGPILKCIVKNVVVRGAKQLVMYAIVDEAENVVDNVFQIKNFIG